MVARRFMLPAACLNPPRLLEPSRFFCHFGCGNHALNVAAGVFLRQDPVRFLRRIDHPDNSGNIVGPHLEAAMKYDITPV